MPETAQPSPSHADTAYGDCTASLTAAPGQVPFQHQDLHVEVPRVPHKDLTGTAILESSATIRQRVNAARQIQHERLASFGLHANSQMQARHIRRFCKLNEQGDKLLEQVTDKLGLSARSFRRILKLARTIADLAGSQQIETFHLAEAIQYRGLDRKMG